MTCIDPPASERGDPWIAARGADRAGRQISTRRELTEHLVPLPLGIPRRGFAAKAVSGHRVGNLRGEGGSRFGV
jgi:hypothetical protein